MNDNDEPTKTCRKCGETKPISGFYRTSKGGVAAQCKDCVKAQSSAYRDANADRLQALRVKNYAANADEIKAERRRERAERGDEINAARKVRRVAEGGAFNERRRAYRAADPEKARAAAKRSRDANPDAWKKYHRAAYLKRISTPQGLLDHNIRGGVHRGLVGGSKAGRHTYDLLGYTVDDLKSHIEAKFLPGMSWENYRKDVWHIDHRVPLDWFDYDTPDDQQFKEAWALSNLQPMWAVDNHSKGARYVADNDNIPIKTIIPKKNWK